MVNWSGGVSGATSGAVGGTAVAPGWGTVIGAIMGGLSGLFTGNKDKIKQIPGLTPEGQQFLSNLFSQLQGDQGGVGGNYGMANDYLSKMLSGDPEAYQQWAAPYETQFQEQTLPRLGEHFASLGGGLGGGAGSSSGFAQALGGAATGFKSNLANLYAQLQQNAASQAFSNYGNLASLALGTSPFVLANRPGTPGFGAAGNGIAEGFGQWAGQKFGNDLSNKFNKPPVNPSGAPAG